MGQVIVGHCLAVLVPVQRRVVGQDRLVQVLQCFPGVDAELSGEQVAGAPVGGERLGLPAAAIQRQHELAVQPLPQRMACGQVLQSPVSASSRPSARSASIRASSAARRSSSRRAASGR